MTQLLRSHQAAKLLGISKRTLHRWAKQGEIKIAQQFPSGECRWEPADVEQLAERIKCGEVTRP